MDTSRYTGVPNGWPKDRPVAISVNLMIEGWEADAAPVSPMANPLKSGVRDTQAQSYGRYGPKVGAWRALDALDRLGVRAMCYVSGILADSNPDLLKTIVDRGHTIAAHAWAQNVLPVYQSPEEEERDIARCVEALERNSGMRPRGWVSPRATPSANTAALLAKAGFTWYSDVFDDDVPYIEETEHGPIVALPFSTEMAEQPFYLRYGNEPEAYARIVRWLLAGWDKLGDRPYCLDITIHPHLFGRPYGILAFIEALEAAQACSHAWLTTHAEIADLYGLGNR